MPYAAPAYPVGTAVPPYAGPTPEQEAESLKGQAEYLETALANIKKRVADLEAKADEPK